MDLTILKQPLCLQNNIIFLSFGNNLIEVDPIIVMESKNNGSRTFYGQCQSLFKGVNLCKLGIFLVVFKSVPISNSCGVQSLRLKKNHVHQLDKTYSKNEENINKIKGIKADSFQSTEGL